MLRRRIFGILMSLALLFGVSATTLLVTAGPANASTAEAVVDMPFSGQWAYNAAVSPPYTDSNSSYPSVHAKYYGDWATDLYPPNSITDAGGEAVKLHVTSPDGTVTFSYNRSNDTCGANVAGHGIVLNVLVNNVVVGSIDYEHLDSISSGPYTNGMTIGYITKESLVGSPSYCYTVRHVHVELKNNTAGTYSCWVDHGSPGVSVTESDHLGVLGSPNTAEREKCTSVPSGTTTPPNNLYVRQGSTLTGKVNLGDAWLTLTNAATDAQAAGQRVAIRDSSGNIEAKDGITGAWLTEAGAVDQYVITPNLLAIRVGGTIYAKAAMTDAWTTVTSSGAVDLKAAGGRIAYLDSSGTVWGRDGVQGASVAETGGVTEYAVTPNLFLVLQGNTLSGKTQLTDQWSTLTYGATDVKAAATRIAIRDTSGNIEAKDGLTGTWVMEIPADQYVVTPDLLLLRQGTTLYGKAGLSDMWTTVGGGVTDVQASGTRIAIKDTNGNIVAKDGLTGTWFTETSGADQYLVASEQ